MFGNLNVASSPPTNARRLLMRRKAKKQLRAEKFCVPFDEKINVDFDGVSLTIIIYLSARSLPVPSR
jgi:hypothetical protein